MTYTSYERAYCVKSELKKVQRCNVIAACIYGKMTTEQLGMLDLSYAPPFSRTWDVLNVAGNVSK